jgi:MerR family copper efflux transcriptional regulator
MTETATRALPLSAGTLLRSGEATLLVGDLARRTGKTVRALHLYEELGLLEPTDRSKGGYRRYRSDAVTRVEWIARLQDAGLSLPDIRELLAGWNDGSSAPDAMLRLSQLYREKLADTRAQIERLNALEHELQASLDYLATCNTCEPVRTVHACSACDRHECQPEEAPLMIAGVTVTPATVTPGTETKAVR